VSFDASSPFTSKTDLLRRRALANPTLGQRLTVHLRHYRAPAGRLWGSDLSSGSDEGEMSCGVHLAIICLAASPYDDC
jgi:hypothetical protein